jgi:phenylacetate-CoA ligase
LNFRCFQKRVLKDTVWGKEARAMTVRQKTAEALYSVTRPTMLKCLGELNRLQWLSEDEQISLQCKRLQQVLEYANTYVPYYHDLFKETGFHPSDFVVDPSCFRELPLLTKDIVRQNFDRLVTTDPKRQDNLVRDRTGGTTGEPMWYMQDRIYDDYRAAHIFHQMEWSGWQLGQPQGWLWGHLPAGAGYETPSVAVRLRDWMVSRFDSNAYILTPESMEKFATQLEKHPGSVVWSYVSSMYRFAQFLQRKGRQVKLHAVYTAAEPLFDYQRQVIESVFGCRVFDSYSCREVGHIACECEQHNGLHIMTRNCYVEVLRDDELVQDGEEGEFILTNLTNMAFPLIRYKIEDWGKKSIRQCPCRRGLPMLDVVEARMIDLFKTRDGKTVYGSFAKNLMPTLGGVKQFQVIQKSLDLLVFRIVQEGAIDQEELLEVERICKMVLGNNVEIKFEFVDTLPLTPSGKHRFLVSEVE